MNRFYKEEMEKSVRLSLLLGDKVLVLCPTEDSAADTRLRLPIHTNLTVSTPEQIKSRVIKEPPLVWIDEASEISLEEWKFIQSRELKNDNPD